MSEPVVPMLSGTGGVSTWTGKDPADRAPGEQFEDVVTHEPLSGKGGVSTWTGKDPADLAELPAATMLSLPADDGPPVDPPDDPPVE
jgi:hypothetical protein